MRTRSLAFLLFVSLAAACGEAASSAAEDTCARADSCNALSGASVKECVEIIETALERLTPTDADELEFAMAMCLDHPACGAFVQCFNDVVDGRSSSGGGGGSGSGGGGAPGGPAPSP